MYAGVLWGQVQDTLVPLGVRHSVVGDAQGRQPPAASTDGEAGTQKCTAEKVSHPTINMVSSEDDFIFFHCLFESYKRSCQLINVADIRDQLLACCETDLRRDLHRYLGTGVDTKSEAELLAKIKRIAVITRSRVG